MKRIFSAESGVRWASALFGLVWLLTAHVSSAAPASGVDAVLLMDSSGSMAKNDPKKLRVAAARLFMSLLGSEDRVGLISFSDNGYPVLHLTEPGPDGNKRILAAVDKVTSKGVYTNIHAALSKGIAMLDKEGREGQEKMLILMSDGKMDVGDSDEDWALTGKLKAELLRHAADRAIKVYTIAFTEDSDISLLREVAEKTQAMFKLAHSDRELHTVFSTIFESAKDPDMLPIEGDEFMVDGSIEEVTIVASKEREDIRVFLQSPGGSRLGVEDAGDKLKWFLSHHFDMITLSDPEPGAWKLLFSGGRNRAYIVTNMALDYKPQQTRLMAGSDGVLESWLEQDGELLNKEAVLTNTRFLMEVEDPTGTRARFDLSDRGENGDRKPADGIYSYTLNYAHPGSYRISLIAEGETFKRQKTVHLEIAPLPAAAENQKAEKPMQPESQAELPVNPVEAVESASEFEPASEPEDVAKEQTGETEGGSAEDPQPPPPPVKEKKANLWLVAAVFIGINLFLGAIVLGVWWLLRQRSKDDDTEADEEEQREAA